MPVTICRCRGSGLTTARFEFPGRSCGTDARPPPPLCRPRRSARASLQLRARQRSARPPRLRGAARSLLQQPSSLLDRPSARRAASVWNASTTRARRGVAFCLPQPVWSSALRGASTAPGLAPSPTDEAMRIGLSCAHWTANPPAASGQIPTTAGRVCARLREKVSQVIARRALPIADRDHVRQFSRLCLVRSLLQRVPSWHR
jgi:hypothetical protein